MRKISPSIICITRNVRKDKGSGLKGKKLELNIYCRVYATEYSVYEYSMGLSPPTVLSHVLP